MLYQLKVRKTINLGKVMAWISIKATRRVLWVMGLVLMLSFQGAYAISAGSIDDFVTALKRGQVNLETLMALQLLDKSPDAIGYGLCMASERPDCIPTGSLGYGLCMAAGRSGCEANGSLGYGLCMAGRRSGCIPQAGLGYGLCMAANRSGCAEEL